MFIYAYVLPGAPGASPFSRRALGAIGPRLAGMAQTTEVAAADGGGLAARPDKPGVKPDSLGLRRGRPTAGSAAGLPPGRRARSFPAWSTRWRPRSQAFWGWPGSAGYQPRGSLNRFMGRPLGLGHMIVSPQAARATARVASTYRMEMGSDSCALSSSKSGFFGNWGWIPSWKPRTGCLGRARSSLTTALLR